MAGSSAGSIFVDVLLNDSKYQQGWNRARRTTRSSVGAMGQQIDVLGKKFDGLNGSITSISRSAVALGASIGASFGLSSIIKYSDTMKQLEGRLRLVTDSTAELTRIQTQLFEVAQRSRTDYAATVTLFQRVAFATKNLGISQKEVIDFTENFNKTLITAGLTGNEVVAVIYQLTQAFNKGKLDGDEFRTVLESAPQVLEALEKQTGKTRAELLKMSRDGLLAPRVLVDAINNMGDVTNERLAGFRLTVSQSFTQLNNAIGRFVDNSPSINSATSGIAEGIAFLAQNVDKVVAGIQALAIAIASKYVISLGSAAAAQVTMLRGMLQVQLALAAMSGYTSRVATGLLALDIASKALVATLLPAGLVAAIYYLITRTTELEDIQNKNIETMNKISELNGIIETGTLKQAEAAKKLREEKVQETIASINHAKALLEEAKGLNIVNALTVARTGQVPTSGFGIGEAEDRLRALSKSLNEQLDAIYAPKGVGSFGTSSGGGSSSGDDKSAARAAEELNRIYERRRVIITGLDQAYFDYQETVADLDKLVEAGTITDQQRYEAIQRYLEETRDKAEETFFDMEAISKRAAENMQDAFADFLFDPFQDGLKGMLKGFIDTMRKIVAEQASAAAFGNNGILGSLFGGLSGAGGLFGSQGVGNRVLSGGGADFIGPLQPFAGFFAEGGYMPPGTWGIAGEEGAEKIYAGRTGVTVMPNGGSNGNTYNIDARGADQGAVRRIESSLLALAGPGVIEKRVTNAQKRGAL